MWYVTAASSVALFSIGLHEGRFSADFGIVGVRSVVGSVFGSGARCSVRL